MEPERVTGEWFHLKDSDINAMDELFASSIGSVYEEPENLELEVYTEQEEIYGPIPSPYEIVRVDPSSEEGKEVPFWSE